MTEENPIIEPLTSFAEKGRLGSVKYPNRDADLEDVYEQLCILLSNEIKNRERTRREALAQGACAVLNGEYRMWKK